MAGFPGFTRPMQPGEEDAVEALLKEAFEGDEEASLVAKLRRDQDMAGPKSMAEIFPNSMLEGSANLLVMPNLDAAHIAMNLIKMGSDGVPIGPILLGCQIPAYIATATTTVRGLVNMTAIAAARVTPEQP